MKKYIIKHGSSTLHVQKKTDEDVIAAWSYDKDDTDLIWFKTTMHAIIRFATENSLVLETVESKPKPKNMFNIDDL